MPVAKYSGFLIYIHPEKGWIYFIFTSVVSGLKNSFIWASPKLIFDAMKVDYCSKSTSFKTNCKKYTKI